MSAVDLLPCPFCGGEAKRSTLPPDEFDNAGGDVIECTGCGASSHVEFGRRENLVSTWNRRAPVSADLSDPVAVHANMLRGTIAKPTPEQIKHLYPDLFAPVSAGKVKALVWGKWGEAKGGGAKYSVYEAGGRGLWNCVCYPHEDQQFRLVEGVSQEAAKAAAQADYEDRILSALQPGDGWQGIESAPKDGTTVILWVVTPYAPQGHMLWPCKVIHDDWCWEISDNAYIDWDYQIIEDKEITHWMPLPTPPSALPLGEDTR